MDGVEDSESIDEDSEAPVARPANHALAQRSFLERAKYIPLRLAYDERKQFRLLEAALNVSEYTDKVDVYTFHKSKVRSKLILFPLRGLIRHHFLIINPNFLF